MLEQHDQKGIDLQPTYYGKSYIRQYDHRPKTIAEGWYFCDFAVTLDFYLLYPHSWYYSFANKGLRRLSCKTSCFSLESSDQTKSTHIFLST